MPADAQELWNRRHTLRVLSELELDGGVAWTRKAAPQTKIASAKHAAQQSAKQTKLEPQITPTETALVAAAAPSLPAQAKFIFLTTDNENPLLDQAPLAELFEKILGAMQLSRADIGIIPLPDGVPQRIHAWLHDILPDTDDRILIALGPQALRAVHLDDNASLIKHHGEPFPLGTTTHTVIATWDIAYLHRNPNAKREAWRALQTALGFKGLCPLKSRVRYADLSSFALAPAN